MVEGVRLKDFGSFKLSDVFRLNQENLLKVVDFLTIDGTALIKCRMSDGSLVYFRSDSFDWGLPSSSLKLSDYLTGSILDLSFHFDLDDGISGEDGVLRLIMLCSFHVDVDTLIQYYKAYCKIVGYVDSKAFDDYIRDFTDESYEVTHGLFNNQELDDYCFMPNFARYGNMSEFVFRCNGLEFSS